VSYRDIRREGPGGGGGVEIERDSEGKRDREGRENNCYKFGESSSRHPCFIYFSGV